MQNNKKWYGVRGFFFGGVIWFVLMFVGVFAGQGGCPFSGPVCGFENFLLSPLSIFFGSSFSTDINSFILNILVYAVIGMLIGVAYGKYKNRDGVVV